DRNRGGCRFYSEHGGGFPRCENRSHPTTSQVGRHHGQSFVVTPPPAECALHILAPDVAPPAPNLAECNHSPRFVRRPHADEPTNRRRRLLRARRERPCRRYAAKYKNKFSPPNGDCHVTLSRIWLPLYLIFS